MAADIAGIQAGDAVDLLQTCYELCLDSTEGLKSFDMNLYGCECRCNTGTLYESCALDSFAGSFAMGILAGVEVTESCNQPGGSCD